LIAFDDLMDVLSVHVAGTRAEDFGPAPTDQHMMIERDKSGRVVGIELFGASTIVPSFWKAHPDRKTVPGEILAELDRWLADRWSALKRA
jgi:uncharacterized protein YuzE